MTKEEFRMKYKDYPSRDEMTEEQELQFVEDSFVSCEQEGFAKVFWSQGGDYPERHGKPFTVIGRTPKNDGVNGGADIECLPMWNIRFEDGFEMAAFPDEIIPSDMRENGCPEKYLSLGTTKSELSD